MTTKQSETGDFTTTQYLFIVIELAVLAAIIRFCAIGTRGLWIDEAYSWAMTQLNWHEFWTAIRHQSADMTVYYVLLKLWVGTGIGDSEAALRSLSALLSVATVPVVAEVGRRLYSAKAGLLAAAIFTVHVFSIQYAQEARSYAAVTFFVSVSWYFLARIVAEPSNGNLFWFGLFSLLAIYSHFLAGLNLVAQVVTLAFAPKNARRSAFLSTLGMIGISLLPGIVYALSRTRQELTWIPPTKWSAIRDFFDLVAGGVGSRIYLALVAVLFAAVVAPTIPLIRARRRSYEPWTASLPVIGVFFPIIALIALSAREPLFVGRYIGFVLLPFIWGIAALFARLGGLRYVAAFALLIATFVIPLADHYRNFILTDRNQNFRGAVQLIAHNEGVEDAIIAWPAYARPGIEYYAERTRNFPEFIYPDRGARFQPANVLVTPDPKELPATLNQKKHIWLVVASSGFKISAPVERYLRTALAERFDLKSERTFYGLTVSEYAPRSIGLK